MVFVLCLMAGYIDIYLSLLHHIMGIGILTSLCQCLVKRLERKISSFLPKRIIGCKMSLLTIAQPTGQARDTQWCANSVVTLLLCNTAACQTGMNTTHITGHLHKGQTNLSMPVASCLEMHHLYHYTHTHNYTHPHTHTHNFATCLKHTR